MCADILFLATKDTKKHEVSVSLTSYSLLAMIICQDSMY